MNPAMLAALQSGGVTIDPSLRLYIPFNEGVGAVAKDYSQYGNNGVLTDVKWGINGGVFNGTSSYVNCGNDPSLNITDAITMEAWVKANNLVGGHAIADKQKDMLDYTQPWRWGLSGSSVGLQMGGGGTTFNNWSFGTITLDNWHLIGFTIEGTSVKGYIDGIQAGSTETFVGTRQSSNLALLIGRRKEGNNFNGSIDGVMIYNRALSALEILNDFEGERPRYGV
jgi:hypothetical protein